MSFCQPCFIRKNTPELRKKLEELGYKICVCSSFDDNIWLNTFLYEDREEVHGIGCWDDSFPCKKEDVFNNYINENNERKNPNIDCGTNEDLFLALAALRDDSDYMQWFICKEEYISISTMDFVKIGTWQLNTQHHKLSYSLKKLWRKATVEEIIEHFKGK